MAVNIIKNTLEEPGKLFHSISFESGKFTIKIIYNGDYPADKANNAIKKELIVPQIKSKGTFIDLVLSGEDAWLDLSSYFKMIRTKQDVEDLYHELLDALDAVTDAKSVYNAYFGQYLTTK